ncbi:hypothetical protein AC482_05940 [miscellaneous Crenarchaeota group-15 archaeon DG-45]|uniref:2-methylcitrate dehydratase n=1 Tax=miscellaneous Crenarchaeota group-15 archaeon DG-45 TaxID=1685127 RepID=A0A0M0BMV6_9ARCH|nr:MAG: hypothetical protein AC482_05940 [miscellaneous Crenarchaeota group-15 archaeon DG-45]
MVGETRALAGFCSGLGFEDLPSEVVDKAKECLLDWTGSALAGSRLRPSVIVAGLVEALGGAPESTVVNSVRKTSCVNAALANGVMSHILELDDVHRASILHPAAPIIPAALALAEREGADGRALIAAVVAGYEAGIRLGEAAGISHYRFWHSTGTCGAFGAAAASGVILGLDGEEMASALGSAGTQASGLWQFMAEGAMSKHLHPGRAASSGVLSALLAGGGFTGSPTIIEGERGFCAATSSDPRLDRVTEGLGRRFKILETSFKAHASCRHTHSAVDAAIRIREAGGLEAGEIAGVRVETYPDALKIAGIDDPQSPHEAKFSLRYCVSTALLRGRLGVEEFTARALADPEVRELMERCEIVVEPDLSMEYPARWPSRVEVTTRGGERLRDHVEYPLGDPANPLPPEALTGKFRTLASKTLPEEEVEAVIDAVFRIEDIQDVGQLTELLRPASTTS